MYEKDARPRPDTDKNDSSAYGIQILLVTKPAVPAIDPLGVITYYSHRM